MACDTIIWRRRADFPLRSWLMCDAVVGLSLHLSIQRQLKPFQLNPGSSILAL